MRDITVRHIDDAMIERIKDLARYREWSINEVVLHALSYGLGLGGDAFSSHDPEFRSVATLSGTWDASEEKAFREALDALDQADPDQMRVVGER